MRPPSEPGARLAQQFHRLLSLAQGGGDPRALICTFNASATGEIQRAVPLLE